jgi:hypothetical protein
MKTRAAQGDAFGAFLLVRVAGSAEVDDVVHVVLCVRQVLCWIKNYCLLVPLKNNWAPSLFHFNSFLFHIAH